MTNEDPRRTGFWKQSRMNNSIYKCSNCMLPVHKSLLFKQIEGNPLLFKYCPSCGSRMERTEETEPYDLQAKMTKAMK